MLDGRLLVGMGIGACGMPVLLAATRRTSARCGLVGGGTAASARRSASSSCAPRGLPGVGAVCKNALVNGGRFEIWSDEKDALNFYGGPHWLRSVERSHGNGT